jgi:hypothetical protein
MASGEKLYLNTLTVTPSADFANSVRPLLRAIPTLHKCSFMHTISNAL